MFNELGIETVAVRCYHCARLAKISAHAINAVCEHCQNRLQIGDIRIKGSHWGGVLMTCGRLTVARRADATCSMAVTSTCAEIMGRFRGVIVSGGPVTIGPRAEFDGAVWAPSLRIEPGASVRGGPMVVPCEPLGKVELNGNRANAPVPPQVSVAAPRVLSGV